MLTYLSYFTYTKDAMRSLVETPEDREAAARKVVEAAGGRLKSFFWMLGDHDGLVIYEVPAVTDAAGVSAAISASGRIASLQTVHLLDSAEVRRSLELASILSGEYHPPGGFAESWRAGYDELG